MERSEIIKEFTDSTLSLEATLKKLIVLLTDIGDYRLINWAKKELRGYSQSDTLPDYRKVTGIFSASFLIGQVKYTNYPFPLTNIPTEERKNFLSANVYQSVASLEKMVNSETNMQKPIPSEFFPLIQHGTNANIIDAHVIFDINTSQEIISKIDEKILEILLSLEKNFGNLDGLTLDLTLKSSADISDISNTIYNIIYCDNSVNIGDKNKITNSSFLTKPNDKTQ